MFDIGSDSPFSDLDEETRESLALLIERRNEYLLAVRILNERKVRLLRNPDPAEEVAVSEYSSLIVAPLRRAMSADIDKLMTKVIDLDKLKEMLPMILMATLGSVNLPLLFEAFGMDPDTLTEIVGKIREFIHDGIS